MIETNKRYYSVPPKLSTINGLTDPGRYFIIREGRYTYYIMDSIDLELLEENPKKFVLEPVFEVEKTYDYEWHLEMFLKEQGINEKEINKKR